VFVFEFHHVCALVFERAHGFDDTRFGGKGNPRAFTVFDAIGPEVAKVFDVGDLGDDEDVGVTAVEFEDVGRIENGDLHVRVTIKWVSISLIDCPADFFESTVGAH
jgi:hypothetical protein